MEAKVEEREKVLEAKEEAPLLPPYLTEGFQPLVGNSTGMFFSPPWHDGPEDGVAWPRLPRTNGQKPSPCGIESGMRADDLSVPSSIAFSNHAEHQLQNDEEYQDLIETSFDDIAHTNTGGAEYAKSWFERRVALETGYFSGKACSLFIKQRLQEDGTGGDDRFQVRVVSRTFAAATRVVNTNEVADIYARIADEAQQHEWRTMASQVAARIERASSTADCDSILDMLCKLLEKYLADRKLKEEQETRDWLARCRSKREELAKKEHAAMVAAGDDCDRDTEEDAEEEEEEAAAAVTAAAPVEQPKKSEEPAVAVAVVSKRPVHVIGATTTLLELEDKNIGHFVCRKEGFIVPDPDPEFAPQKEYVEEKKPKKDGKDEHTGDPMLTRPLAEILEEKKAEAKETMEETVSKMAAEEGKEKTWYTDNLVSGKIGDEEGRKEFVPSTVVVAKQPVLREITRFERITDERIRSTLHGINLTPGCSTARWRDLKTPILIPCAMDAHETSVLVVDHDRARVLLMPSGQETGETYSLLAAADGGVGFKVVACSINAFHILILGYRAGHNAPTLVVISRIDRHPTAIVAAGARKRRVTVFSSNIPMVSAILSDRPIKDAKAEEPSMLVGFVDGTILRLPINPLAGSEASTVHAIFAPSQKMCDAEQEKDKERKGEIKAKYDGRVLSAAKRKRVRVRTLVTAFNPDEMLWSGYTAPITRIVEHGKRIVASSPMGLHIFKLNIPYTIEMPLPSGAGGATAEKKSIVKRAERVAHLPLEHNASFDFRGNILAVHKTNNSFELVNMHTYKLEACIGTPSSMNPVPPDIFVECSSISLDDSRILFMHSDGSYRSLDINDYNLFTTALTRSTALPAEKREASFLVGKATDEKTKKSKGGGKRKKNSKAKKGK